MKITQITKIKSITNITKSKVVAVIVCLFVIALLVLSGPAAAFSANFGALTDDNTKKGEKVSSVFEVNMLANERTDITSIVLYSNNINICEFDALGNNLTACNGINVSKLNSSNADYGYGYNSGYGYGYGYGSSTSSKLVYNITLDSSKFLVGKHIMHLVVETNNLGNRISGNQTLLVSSSGDAQYAATINVTGNQTINSAEFNALIDLKFEGNASGYIIIEKYSQRPNGTSMFSIPELGIYLNIDVSNLVGNLSNETEIRVYYTDQQVANAGIDENKLRLYFWNESTLNWDSPITTGVNTTGNYVWAKTNHFSSWGVFGDKVAESDDEDEDEKENKGGSGGCITSWQCSGWGKCINGVQTRECEKIRFECYAGQIPVLERTCIEEGTIDLTNENDNKSFFGITGNVIGNAIGTTEGKIILGVVGFVVIVLLLLLLAGRMKRRNSGKKDIYYHPENPSDLEQEELEYNARDINGANKDNGKSFTKAAVLITLFSMIVDAALLFTIVYFVL